MFILMVRCCRPITIQTFKKYKNFVGNYGNAWWKQNEEFEKFNGPILMTTNCLTSPRDSYRNRVLLPEQLDIRE